MTKLSNGILFSGWEENVKDAVEHLKDNKELYWTVGFNIKLVELNFPLTGLLHVKGDNVRYKCNIIDIRPFSSSDYKEPSKKPERWCIEWRNNPREYKTTLIINSVNRFYYETKELVKMDGEKVKIPPRRYIKVFIPE